MSQSPKGIDYTRDNKEKPQKQLKPNGPFVSFFYDAGIATNSADHLLLLAFVCAQFKRSIF